MKRLLVLLYISITLIACTNQVFDVEYKAECENCRVAYFDENSEFVRIDNVSGNWSTAFQVRSGTLLKVSAQNYGDSSFVAVSLFVNGQLKDFDQNENRRFAAAIASYQIE